MRKLVRHACAVRAEPRFAWAACATGPRARLILTSEPTDCPSPPKLLPRRLRHRQEQAPGDRPVRAAQGKPVAQKGGAWSAIWLDARWPSLPRHAVPHLCRRNALCVRLHAQWRRAGPLAASSQRERQGRRQRARVSLRKQTSLRSSHRPLRVLRCRPSIAPHDA
eukprot:2441160-Prymnesium_polylepis.1